MVPLPATVQLEPSHAGKRVERVLLQALPGIKESFLLMLIHRGKVLIEGRPLVRGERLPGAGRVEVLPPDREERRGPRPNPSIELSVRHEDADVIVVEKPSGIAMHPGPQHGTRTLQNALVARYPELVELGAKRGFGLVQRLDKGVSGLVVVARSVRAHEALVAAFTAREPEKRYRALTVGQLPANEGTVTTPVEGREAETHWKRLNRTPFGPLNLVELHPLTGRKHQLRIHMAGLGSPILGDKQYGPDTLDLARHLGVTRIALHAESLAFDHPVTGERLHFTLAWPLELENAWHGARKQR